MQNSSFCTLTWNIEGFLRKVASRHSSAAAIQAASEALSSARSKLKHAERSLQRQAGIDRDNKLNSVISGNCRDMYKSIKSSKTASTKITSIRVGDQTYEGEHVPDGFFDSMSRLKHPDLSNIEKTPHFQSTLYDYKNIVKMCESRQKMPPISVEQSTAILRCVKPEVNDYYSITANHFINAGPAGIHHFHFLLSTVITLM